VFGHVDRALAQSFRPTGMGPQVSTFSNCIARVLAGKCLGNASKDFTDASAVLTFQLFEIARTQAQVDDATLADLWAQRADAVSYMLLGDPAARLAVTPAAPPPAAGA
jgi:hypothetical protein